MNVAGLTAGWGVGDWIFIALGIVMLAAGAYQLVFADRLYEKAEEKRLAIGPDAPVGRDPRTTGFISLVVGALLLVRHLF